MKVMENALKRAQVCINARGEHFMEIIFANCQEEVTCMTDDYLERS